jgi:hypothetical protein
VSRDTARYLSVYRSIPRGTRGKDEDQRLYLKRRAHAPCGKERVVKSEPKSEPKSEVNCCVKKKAQTMYIDALYRGVGQNFSTPENTESPLVRFQSDDGENQRQAETSKDKQD